MPTAKRERKRAGRTARREAEWRAWRRRRRLRLAGGLLVVAAMLGGVFAVLAGTGSGTAPATTTLPTTTAVALPAITTPPPGERIEGPTPCPPADGTATRTTSFSEPPPDCLSPGVDYLAEVVTTKGSFTIDLLEDEAPLTVNNFVVLSRYRFYDGVPFHRIVTGFVNQTGDATGDPPGTGGPGYTIPDELPPPGTPYVPGDVAMANSGPDTNGSQWFVVVGENSLDTAFSKFGRVVEGMDTVEAINAAGSPTQAGEPTEEILIEQVRIIERPSPAG